MESSHYYFEDRSLNFCITKKICTVYRKRKTKLSCNASISTNYQTNMITQYNNFCMHSLDILKHLKKKEWISNNDIKIIYIFMLSYTIVFVVRHFTRLYCNSGFFPFLFLLSLLSYIYIYNVCTCM